MDSLGPAVQNALVYVQAQPLTSLILTFLAICLTTRLVTGQSATSRSPSSSKTARLPPAAPYWLPYFGHLPQLASNGDTFFTSLRKAYPNGVFSLNLLGKTHTVIFDPELTVALSDQPDHIMNGDHISKHLLHTNFAYPRSKVDSDLYNRLMLDIHQVFEKFASPDSLKQTLEAMTVRLRHNIADFVTFNTQEVDQVHWERLADAYFLEDAAGAQATEAELFELVRNFVAFTASASVFGTDFIENFHEVWQPFWRFSDGFMALAADLPAVLPVNRAIGARRARGQVLRCLDEFETALETIREGVYPGPQWADIDNISPLIADRVDQVFRKHDLDLRKRASLDFSLLWGLNAIANPLIFWSIWRVYSNIGLLRRIREEIAPHVVLEKPAVGFGGTYASTTRIEKMDIDGLLEKCPLLKSACIETMRLDSGSWKFHLVQKDTVIGSTEDAAEKWFLPAGTYVHAAYGLHHTDPNAFPEPEKYDAERHLDDVNANKAHAVDQSRVVPLGKLFRYQPITCGSLTASQVKQQVFSNVEI